MPTAINTLTKADIGKWVEYASYNIEKGRIKFFNDRWIFVVFHCDDKWDNFENYTAAACSPESITIIQPPDKGRKQRCEMLVSELIAELEQCHQKMEVYIESLDGEQDYFCNGIHVDNGAVFIETAE